MTILRPWTLVLSEYLDLPFVLRKTGEAVVAVRSSEEALEHLSRWCPARIIVDPDCYGVEQVVQYARRHYPDSKLEYQDQVIGMLLAS